MKKILVSFVFLGTALAFSSPSHADFCDPQTSNASCIGQPCTTTGMTQLDYGKTGIIACIINAATTQNIWASMTSGDPVGTIIAWPSPTLPADGKWIECDGQSTLSYPQLALIVGPNAPDYRGFFLRGYGSFTVRDNFGMVTHSSGIVGAIQHDAIRNITGSMTLNGVEAWPSTTGAFSKNGEVDQNGYGHNGGPVPILNFNASSVVPTDTENRPVNKAVYWLIKAIP